MLSCDIVEILYQSRMRVARDGYFVFFFGKVVNSLKRNSFLRFCVIRCLIIFREKLKSFLFLPESFFFILGDVEGSFGMKKV